MRIRKRFLSLSAALTASPPSDHLAGGNHHPPPSSSDQTTQIGAGSNLHTTKEVESEKKKDIIKTDDSARKESMLCVKGNKHDLGWVEGDMVIPVKKRRGSHGKSVMNHGFQEDNETIEGTMKTKAKNSKKNEKRGNVIVEGSRCSRVNGRGWRCGQQTLVGYSLCEHHLEKGRLRSMKKTDTHHGFKDDVKDCEDEKVSSSANVENIGKRRKLGAAKARSLSSLLSQTFK